MIEESNGEWLEWPKTTWVFVATGVKCLLELCKIWENLKEISHKIFG